MTIAGGTSGSCTWSISDAGALTVRPTSGTSGVLYHGILSQYPWKDYNSQITSAAFSGSIRLGMDLFVEVIDGSALGMFQGCTNLTSVSGISSLRGVVNMQVMFSSCSSLTTLDLTGLTAMNVRATLMFNGCDVLSSVTFGSSFSIADSGNTGFVQFGKACENTTNGIVVTSDDAFRALTAAERAGTWTRGVDASFKATAERSTGGVADEDGEDVTFSITWATDATTTERTLTIYQKAASASGYPSTPAYTATLTGDSGVATPTLSNIGDDAYDFKVEFYDGTNTFIAYPSVQSNIRLMTLDEQGNGEFAGDVSAVDGIFSGDVSAVDGTFTGDVSAAGGTFTGDVSAADLSIEDCDTHDNAHSFASPTASGNVYGNTWRCYDSRGVSVGYAQTANTPTGVYRSYAVTNPRSGSAGTVGMYIYSNDDGTMDANLTAGCTWRADDIPDGMPSAKITSDSTTTISNVITAGSGWSITTVNAQRWGRMCALTVQAKKSSAITLPVTGDIDNQVIGTLKTGYLPADYAPGMCSTYSGFALLYTNGEVRWLTAKPRSSAGSVAANTNLYFRFHYMLA